MKESFEQINLETHKLLQDYNESQLYKELSLRMKALEEDPLQGISVRPMRELTVSDTEEYRWTELGQNIFERWNKSLYEIICSKDDINKNERKKIKEAFKSEDLLAAAITILLIKMAIVPAVAAVLSALIVKIFFKPVYEEFCAFWKESLPKVAEPI